MLTILIPAYNEEGTVTPTVEGLAAEFDASGIDYEILIVNDGSTDGTEAVLRQIAARFPRVRHVLNPGPHGYGRAIRFGLDAMAGDAVVITMADGSDAPADVRRVAGPVLEGIDCGFGSRFSPGATVEGYPRLKLLFNRLGNRLIGWLLGSPYDDFTNGFKAFRRPVIDAMRPFVGAEFNLTIEMSIKAVQSGAKFQVVPTNWRDREAGGSKFQLFRQLWLYLLTVLYCRLLHRLGRMGRLRTRPVPGLSAPVVAEVADR